MPDASSSTLPLVSVIVPTKNSGAFLEACLQSIKDQTYTNIELIVVDNSSTDDTQEIAQKFTDKVFTKGPERSAQRNFGAEEAKGEYVVFIDSDMELSKKVIKSCVEVCSADTSIKGVIIPEESFGEGFWAQCKKLERSFYIGLDWMEGARFFSKKAFFEFNGYDETNTGTEDYDLPQRIETKYGKGSLSRIPEFIYHNEQKLSLLKTCKKKFYYAGRLDRYRSIEANKSKFNKQSSIVARYKLFFSRPKTLFQNPVLGLGMLFMKTCEMFSGALGYIFRANIAPSITSNDNKNIIKTLDEYHENKDVQLPLVSVIIACKNTAEYFEQCLLSVRNQTYKNIEIVIVDNFSTDGTFEIGKKYADKAFQIGPERSTQFNFGFKHSSGSLTYRIGPDYVLEPDVIEKCVEKIKEGYDALALHNRSVGDSIWAKVRYLERESYRNDNTIVAVRFLKREVFEDLGMFDETLVAGEDFDLHNRMVKAGYKWAHVDAIENHIGEPKNIFDVWNKFYYYGRTIRRYQAKNKDSAKQQLVFFRPSFKKIQKELRKSPKLFAAFYFYMFIKYSAGSIGVLRGAPSNLKKVN